MRAVLRFVALAVGVAFALPAVADAPRVIQWADLVPKGTVAENPFAKLTRDQLQALSDVAGIRDRKAKGDKSLSSSDLAIERNTARRLEQNGIDVDALLAKRRAMSEHRAAVQVNPLLDGLTVRLPGYVLPLEITGRKVTEFLLVPWVGACIHTPPPPPNQIVHVKTDAPFELTGLFMPVWITGRLSAGATKKSLYLVDGTSDIDIGYSVKASRVEPYAQ